MKIDTHQHRHSRDKRDIPGSRDVGGDCESPTPPETRMDSPLFCRIQAMYLAGYPGSYREGCRGLSEGKPIGAGVHQDVVSGLELPAQDGL